MDIEAIDLTNDNVQGTFSHDKIDKLTEPGLYRLRFRTTSGRQDIVVKVIAVYDNRMQHIVVIDSHDDMEYIFYYNGNEQQFKLLDLNHDADKVLQDCKLA